MTTASAPSARDFDAPCRILSLDGGGAKGLYTLGVLKEMEAMAAVPLYQCFDLIVGTSTGAIIGALLGLGYQVEEAHRLYREYLPPIIRERTARARSAALASLADALFVDRSFADFKTGVGIVVTRWDFETPMVLKARMPRARRRLGTYLPGLGCSIADAVQGACSAYPIFLKHAVKTANGETIELTDGRQCASNPIAFAIANAALEFGRVPPDLRVVSVGAGVFPQQKTWQQWLPTQRAASVLQTMWNVNTASMDQLSCTLFPDVWIARINDTFGSPELGPDLVEADLGRLDRLYSRGADSFARRAAEIQKMMFCEAGPEQLALYGDLRDFRDHAARRTPDRLVG